MENEKMLAIMAYLNKPNAAFAFEDFKKAISSSDNRLIEESRAIQLLDKVLSDGNCPFKKPLQKDTVLYRGRLVDFQKPLNGIRIIGNKGNEKYIGYDKYASKEPPIGSQNEGRCNINGMSYLYLAEDKYTACAELKVPYRYIGSIASFKIMKDLKILDFSEDVTMPLKYRELFREYGFMPAHMMTHLMASFTTPVTCSDDHNYNATQYITDQIRKTGYDGIAYRSYFSGKTNYAIFNCYSDNVVFVESHLMLIESRGYQITSLDDELIIDGKKPDCNVSKIKENIREEVMIKEGKEHAEKK